MLAFNTFILAASLLAGQTAAGLPAVSNAQQQPLWPPHQKSGHPSQHYLDARENSVGLQILTDEGKTLPFWLPVGERIFTRRSTP